MRYVLYVAVTVLLGVVWLNNSDHGRQIKHRISAAGENGSAQYRSD